MFSSVEENYLKALYFLTILHEDSGDAGTNELASHLNIKPASVNSMLKKLKQKHLIDYEKYGRIKLTSEGSLHAIRIVRRHRLWETFLYEKLGFAWDEIHEIAEQLEHIQSEKLVQRLDQFLGYPQFDPHGDIIPGSDGSLPIQRSEPLSTKGIGQEFIITAVADTSGSFLNFLDHLGIKLGSTVEILDTIAFDGSYRILINKHRESMVSKLFAENLLVR